MNDQIGDMVNRIKNAGFSGLTETAFPYSKMKESICETLKKEGYIKNFSTRGKKVSNKELVVDLAYEGNKPKVAGFERVSKLSRRMYSSASEMPTVKNGFGLLVVSTPKGIMSGSNARKEHVGGELLFKIW